MKPKLIAALLFVFILLLALIYVGFSFVYWNFNPFSWSIESRALAALLGAGAIFIIALFVTTVDPTKN